MGILQKPEDKRYMGKDKKVTGFHVSERRI